MLLDIIRIEMENMDTGSMSEPLTEVFEGDHVVGEIGTDLKKLYSLAIRWDKEAMATLVSARYVGNIAQCCDLITKAAELRKKSELLLEIFWISLKDTFGLWDKPTIGIRKGWKVVWTISEAIIISADELFDAIKKQNGE